LDQRHSLSQLHRVGLSALFYKPLGLRLWVFRLFRVGLPQTTALSTDILADAESSAALAVRQLGAAFAVLIASMVLYFGAWLPLQRAFIAPLVRPLFFAVGTAFESLGMTHSSAGNVANAVTLLLIVVAGMVNALVVIGPYIYFLRRSEGGAAVTTAALFAARDSAGEVDDSLDGFPRCRYAYSRLFTD